MNIKTIIPWAVFGVLVVIGVFFVGYPMYNVISEPKVSMTKPLKSLRVENNVILLNGREVYRFIPVDGGRARLGGILRDYLNLVSDDNQEHLTPVYIYADKYVEGFLIGTTPVTSDLFNYVLNDTLPESSAGIHVYPSKEAQAKWFDFVNRLNKMTGRHFRLPSVYEWKYAAMGGKQSNNYKYAGSDCIDEVSFYAGNNPWKIDSTSRHFDLGMIKNPNELGIYDMSGSVWELTSSHLYEFDSFHKANYYSLKEKEKQGVKLSEEDMRWKIAAEGFICLGGAFDSTAEECQIDYLPGGRKAYSGARLILEY